TLSYHITLFGPIGADVRHITCMIFIKGISMRGGKRQGSGGPIGALNRAAGAHKARICGNLG
ncbi:MAG: hypothetical protein QMB16_01405, partial [Paracoccaceae bacterium]